MKRGAFAIIAIALESGCSAGVPQPAQTPTDPAEAGLVVGGEGRSGGGWGAPGTEAKWVGGFSATAGYRPGSCCAVEAYAGKSYLSSDGRPATHKDGITKTDRQDKELFDLGLGLDAQVPTSYAFWRRLHVRFRLGLTAAPPEDQDQMRRGFSGDMALLLRLTNPEVAPPVGGAIPRIDFLLDAQGWGLARRHTSAGLEQETATIVAVTAGLRVLLDYGIDLR